MRLWLPLFATLLVVACSGEEAAGPEEGGGARPEGGPAGGKAGASGQGAGSAGAAGDTTTGQGGASVVGGAAGSTSSGGATAAGGASAVGGATSAGGASTMGGAAGAGVSGAAGKGGTGGTGGTGGASGTGGSGGTGGGAGTSAGNGGSGASVPPVLVISTTLDGPSTTSIPNSRVIYLRLSGLTATNAAGCVEIVGTSDGACASPPTNWGNLPNQDWSYDEATKLWRAALPKWAYPPGTYRFFNRNTATGAQATPTVFQLTGPKLVFSLTPDGPKAEQFPWSSTVYGRIAGVTANDTAGCVEVGPNGTECDTPGVGYTKLPNADWSYDASAQLWRSALKANAFPPNTYVSHAYDSDDESWSGGVPFTLEAPVCAWAAAVFGGDNPEKPAIACTTANIGATEPAGGYTWTCGCK